MVAKLVHPCRVHLLRRGVLGLFHMLGNTSFCTEQDTALRRIWWSLRQCMPAFSLAPMAPLLLMFRLSHYGMHTVVQRRVRVAACREGCPISLLLSSHGCKIHWGSVCSGATRTVICCLCTEICCN